MPNMVQAFEILQLYLELLSIRMALIDKTRDLPPDMVEAISSLIYASQRTAELQVSGSKLHPPSSLLPAETIPVHIGSSQLASLKLDQQGIITSQKSVEVQ